MKSYQKGVFARTHIRVESGERTTVTFRTEGTYPQTVERLTLRFVSKEKGACWVSVDGKRIPRFLVREGWEEADAGWYYNLSDRTVWVKCPKPDAAEFQIVVSAEKFDLIGMAED